MSLNKRNFDLIDLTDDNDDDNDKNRQKTLKKDHCHDFKWKPFYLLSSQDIDDLTSLSIKDLLNVDYTISLVVFLNFMIDIDWLVSNNPILTTIPVHCIHGADLTLPCSYPNIATSKVDMGLETYGSHHGKIAIIFTEIGVRICILTANFIEMDFEYLVNAVFIQDFPMKSSSSVHNNTNDFYNDLIDYLESIRISNHRKIDELVALLSQYDFTSAEVILIPSIPGRFKGQSNSKWGQSKLESCLRRHNRTNSQNESLVMQCSSIGSFGKKDKYFNEIVQSMKSNSSSTFSSANILDAKYHFDNIQIIWPTVASVRDANVVCIILSLKPIYSSLKILFRVMQRDRHYDVQIK